MRINIHAAVVCLITMLAVALLPNPLVGAVVVFLAPQPLVVTKVLDHLKAKARDDALRHVFYSEILIIAGAIGYFLIKRLLTLR